MIPPGPNAVLTFKLTTVTAALLLTQLAAAQTEPAQPPKGMERAQKAADAVFNWIKLNGDKGATRQGATATAPAPAGAPAPAPAGTPAPAPATASAAPRKAAPAPVAAAAPGAKIAAAPASAAAASKSDAQQSTLLASAAPTPAPAAPLPAATRAVEPPPVEEPEEVPLKLLMRVNPTIPRQLQQTSFTNGFARVKFTVAPDGSVSSAETLAASHSRLGTASVDAVKQWRFSPIPAAREVAVEFAFNNAED